jgi:zinc transport system substrate-binding protein
MKLRFAFPLLLALAVLFPAAASAVTPVCVSILPQKYFLEKIGGDLVDITVLVPPGASPHTYEPKPGQMVAVSKAKAYFAIGVPFENAWLGRLKAGNPDMPVVQTQSGVEKIPMAAHSEHEEAHAGKAEGDDHEEHAGLDPHIWLDPNLVKIQAKNIVEGLKTADPANAAAYAANYRTFLKECDALDATIRKTLAAASAAHSSFIVFHPSWGYFAKAYGLTQIPIEVEGKEPSPKELASLITFARDKGVNVIFVQPQFSEKSASVVAKEAGATLARLDPLAEDWNGNLLHAAEALRNAVK